MLSLIKWFVYLFHFSPLPSSGSSTVWLYQSRSRRLSTTLPGQQMLRCSCGSRTDAVSSSRPNPATFVAWVCTKTDSILPSLLHTDCGQVRFYPFQRPPSLSLSLPPCKKIYISHFRSLSGGVVCRNAGPHRCTGDHTNFTHTGQQTHRLLNPPFQFQRSRVPFRGQYGPGTLLPGHQ